MHLLDCQYRMLEVLSEKINVPRPGLISTGEIAASLKLPREEAKKILKSLLRKEMVEVDMEGENCLITRSGLELVMSRSQRLLHELK